MTGDNGKIALPSSLGYLIITWYAKREEGYQSQARQILLATNKRADRLKQSIEGDIHDGSLQNAILVQRDKHLITSKHTWFAWNLHYVACPTVLGMSSNSEMCKDKFCNSFVWINSYETGKVLSEDGTVLVTQKRKEVSWTVMLSSLTSDYSLPWNVEKKDLLAQF